MIKFNDVEEALNSSRMVMVSYLIQAVRSTVDNQITFSDKAYQFVSHDDAGKVEYLKPLMLHMYNDNGTASHSHCVLTYSVNGSKSEMYIHDMAADDLFALSEMVYKISKDKLPIVQQDKEETIDLKEYEYEVLN